MIKFPKKNNNISLKFINKTQTKILKKNKSKHYLLLNYNFYKKIKNIK
jgi:hypothetical protein